MGVKRGDTVNVHGLGIGMRVVLVKDDEALLSHEPLVSAEENAARKARGERPLAARVRFEVAPLAQCVPA